MRESDTLARFGAVSGDLEEPRHSVGVGDRGRPLAAGVFAASR
jgi:hypothetical protein